MVSIDKIADVVNDQKGELMALQCLVISLLRAMPADMQARALAEFDRETVIGAGVLRHSELPKAVAEGFSRYVEHLNMLRKPGPSRGST
ncbi:MAG: hypothetical protein ABIS17_04465 [Casimicrobiaceae bacterium]